MASDLNPCPLLLKEKWSVADALPLRRGHLDLPQSERGSLSDVEDLGGAEQMGQIRVDLPFAHAPGHSHRNTSPVVSAYITASIRLRSELDQGMPFQIESWK